MCQHCSIKHWSFVHYHQVCIAVTQTLMMVIANSPTPVAQHLVWHGVSNWTPLQCCPQALGPTCLCSLVCVTLCNKPHSHAKAFDLTLLCESAGDKSVGLHDSL